MTKNLTNGTEEMYPVSLSRITLDFDSSNPQSLNGKVSRDAMLMSVPKPGEQQHLGFTFVVPIDPQFKSDHEKMIVLDMEAKRVSGHVGFGSFDNRSGYWLCVSELDKNGGLIKNHTLPIDVWGYRH